MIRQSLLTLISSVCLVTSIQADECTYRRASPVYEATDFSPLVADDLYEITPQIETNATLFRRGQNGDLIPELGQSFEVDYESKKLTVTLNPECGWSDGTNITAHDYVEGLRLLFSEKAKETYIPGRELFKLAPRILSGEFPPSALGVRAEGPHTVVFDLTVPPDMLMTISTYVSMTPAPTHLMKDDPSAWPSSSLLRVSSGPFVAVEQTDERIILEPNPHYCQGSQPSIQRVELINEDDDSKTLALFREGKLDVLEGLSKAQTQALQADKPEVWLTKNMSEKMIQYLFITNGLVDKPDVRQALLSSIDREQIVNEVLKDRYVYLHDSLNFPYRGYPATESGEAFHLDHATRIKRAQAVMQKHGYGPENRVPMSLGFFDNEALLPLVESLRDQFAQIYIDISFNQTNDYGELFSSDLFVPEWFSDFDDPFNTLSAFSGDFSAQEPQILAGVQATNNEFDHATRFAKLNALEQQLMDTHYLLPLFMFSVPVAVAGDVSFGDERYPAARNASKAYCFPES